MPDTKFPDMRRLGAFGDPVDDTDIAALGTTSYLLFGGRISVGTDSGPVRPWITSHLGGAPGEPVRVKWRFYAGEAAVGATVTARILYESHVLYTSPPIAVQNRNVHIQNVDVVVESDVVAQLFYKFGPKTIQLTVTGDSGLSYTAELEWTIVSNVLAAGWTAPWIGWEVLEANVPWHSDFSVGCAFKNQTPYTAMQVVHVRLGESTFNWHNVLEGEPNAYAGQWDLGGPVLPGTYLPHTFSIPGKDWFWRNRRPDFAVAAGGHFKDHQYTAFLTMTDIYGNVYPEISSAETSVRVAVSERKENYAYVATASAATAAGLAVGGFFLCIPCAAAAAFAYAAAEIADTIANNHPPGPGEAFMDRVELSATTETRVGPPLDSAGRYFSITNRLLASERALKAVHGKFLGASAAGSLEGKRLQTARYLEIEQSLGSLLAELTTAGGEMQRALAQTGKYTLENRRTAMEGMANGFPPEMRTTMRNAGVDDATIEQLSNAVINPVLRQAVLSSTDALPPIDRLTEAMKLATESVLRSRPHGITP